MIIWLELNLIKFDVWNSENFLAQRGQSALLHLPTKKQAWGKTACTSTDCKIRYLLKSHRNSKDWHVPPPPFLLTYTHRVSSSEYRIKPENLESNPPPPEQQLTWTRKTTISFGCFWCVHFSDFKPEVKWILKSWSRWVQKIQYRNHWHQFINCIQNIRSLRKKKSTFIK